MDKYEQLEKLADLKTKGILNDTEYEEQKTKLLAQRMTQLNSGTQASTTSIALNPYWEAEFAKIEEVGLPAYKKFNWPAFFFTWIWAFTKGLWQNALITLGILIGTTILDIIIDVPALSYGLNIGLPIGLSVMYGQTGNKWYYRKAIKNEAVFLS
jgi:hypothetical protein